MDIRGRSTVHGLRRENRARALWDLYLNGPGSRQRIGAGAGVSPGTVSNVVGDLMDQGLVQESGSLPSGGGRPSSIVQIDPGYASVVGVDVGESSVLVELFDLAMQVRGRQRVPTELARLSPTEVVGQIVAGVGAVLEQSGAGTDDVLGVGVGVPGLVEHAPLAVVHAQTVGWDAVPLEALLREHTPLPLAVDNGAKLLGQAEHWFGAARGATDVVVVLLGHGLGTSIFTRGSGARTPMSSPGEWGHTAVVVDGQPCRCGARGCLEAYVGAGAVAARYDQLRGSTDGPPDVEARVTALLARAGTDPAAATVLDEVVRYLGAGIGNLVNVYSPTRVVLGGWLGRQLAELRMPEIAAAAAQNALRTPFADVELLRADLGADAVALGAATLPVGRFLSSGGQRDAVHRSSPA
ncbi:ROK family protein [Modestobacter sp. L9-4]|uniref:ROK family transcriptional regulator n=1 Tax=Modestobacter sp. L9-4 TaxID=2851567 RepID=UPI001C78FE7F|nr:ROK family protein [Modestobacter sp. L9-4]QXG75222.1 ROK family protein [Modestobacter sp. L9-4]